MLQIIRLEDGKVIGIAEALGDEDTPYLSIDDMLTRLIQLQTDGVIKIEPNAAQLQTMAVRAALQRYTQTEKMPDGLRQYVSDRRGGRINLGTRRLGELAELHRREAVASIQRFMLMEGPKAYESQAALLGMIDPTVDAEFVARQSSEAVGDAVRRGVAQGREAVEPKSEAV